MAERNVKRKTISEQTKQAVVEWYQSGHTEKMCAKKFGISPASAHRIIAAAKEKEPAAAATATDSAVKTLQVQDTTSWTESQALEAAKKKLLAIYETLTPEECRAWELGEVYAEVVRGCGE